MELQRVCSLEAIAVSEINIIHCVNRCLHFRVERGGMGRIIILLSQLTVKQQYHGLTHGF